MDWEILIHGTQTALAGHQLESAPWLGTAAGAGIGVSSVFMADQAVDRLMHNPEAEKKSPMEAALVGGIEDTLSFMALSVMLDNPVTLSTVGMSTLLGLPSGLAIHTLEGQVDWEDPLGWK